MNYHTLLGPVKAAALEASKSVERAPGQLETKRKGPNDFVTRVDLEISAFLTNTLSGLLDGSVVISEESENRNLNAALRWIIDPIDGTNNLIFALPFYAISIGLVEDDQPVLGCVLLPGTGELFSAARACGAYYENIYTGASARIQTQKSKRLSDVIVMAETDPYFERSKNPSIDILQSVFMRCIDCRISGSAAIDYSYIASGRAGVHFCRNINAWDYAGGAAILGEAGGVMSQWNGKALDYRSKATSLASCGKAVHEQMLELFAPFL
ncbi:MAG: inositol monophosphatase family protein [Treponema sp.]|jgi:myo-inositol-1(or 4)-monophosphatase|nr:inositol monophosphatase family protein [Treponema sp.]